MPSVMRARAKQMEVGTTARRITCPILERTPISDIRSRMFPIPSRKTRNFSALEITLRKDSGQSKT